MATELHPGSGFDQWLDLLATPPQFEVCCADLPIHRTSSLNFFLPSGLCDDVPEPNPEGQGLPPELDDLAYLNVQYPGELEDRSIIVSNLPPEITEPVLYNIASQFGDVESVALDWSAHVATARFYDIRSAYKMRAAQLGCGAQAWLIQFAPPQPIVNRRRPPNNGTIVLFHLKPGLTDGEIEQEFSQYGEIRQIRSPPDRDTQRFVEFWDTRDALAALRGARGRTVLQSKISVEFSLPGGYRKYLEAVPENRLPTISRKTVVPCAINF
jgi:RNA recognition motif-containing protein